MRRRTFLAAPIIAASAAALGKETAVWVSTGTLANHLAVRTCHGNCQKAGILLREIW